MLVDEPAGRNYNLIFLASAEEEVSGKNGIESALPLLPKVDVALVGEPTGMQPAIAEKGLVVLDGVAHGKSGHAARGEGVNALYIAVDAINRLRSFRFERESELLGPVKVTVTGVQAGTTHNVIPDTCTFMVDCRTTDAYSNDEVVEMLRNEIAKVESPLAGQGPVVELTPRSTRLQPSSIPLDHPLLKRILALGRKPFGSPTLSDQALMRFPSLKMGPGQSSRSHTADEYIRPEEIREALDIYYQLLKELEL
jgi:acetylornithine deacetylase